MSKLDEMKQEIEELRNTVAMLEGFRQGQVKLYENALDEITDLKRQLEDEKKVRQVMREAVTGHTDERDSVMERMAECFFGSYMDKKGQRRVHKFKDLNEMCERSMAKHLGLQTRLEETERKLSDAIKANEGISILQDYVIEIGGGRIVGYKAKDAASAIRHAQRDGHTVHKSYTKEEYELKKWG